MTLVLAAILFGALSQCWYRLTAHRAKVGVAVKRIAAQFLEMRLYFDQPRIVWRAHVQLLRWNMRLLRALAWPILLTSAPIAAFLIFAQPWFGYEPLHDRDFAVLIAQLRGTPRELNLQASGIEMDLPPVRSAFDNQVTWRMRAIDPEHAQIKLNSSEIPVNRGGRVRIDEPSVEWVELQREKSSAWLWRFSVIMAAAAWISSLLWSAVSRVPARR